MQKLVLAVAALVVGVTAGCGSTRTVVNTAAVVSGPPPSAIGDQRIYGHIRSVTRHGNRYLLRIDPGWFVSGVTANVAQAEDERKTCDPFACPPVANDSTVVEEGHRTLAYVLPATTRGTVLVSSSTRKTITAAQLAQLVAHPGSIKTYEPLASGVWLLVHVDTVRTFAQQYVP